MNNCLGLPLKTSAASAKSRGQRAAIDLIPNWPTKLVTGGQRGDDATRVTHPYLQDVVEADLKHLSEHQKVVAIVVEKGRPIDTNATTEIDIDTTNQDLAQGLAPGLAMIDGRIGGIEARAIDHPEIVLAIVQRETGIASIGRRGSVPGIGLGIDQAREGIAMIATTTTTIGTETMIQTGGTSRDGDRSGQS